MKMSPGDIISYPKFHSDVKCDIPRLVCVNRIVAAIKKISGSTTRVTIKKGFIWDSIQQLKLCRRYCVVGLSLMVATHTQSGEIITL